MYRILVLLSCGISVFAQDLPLPETRALPSEVGKYEGVWANTGYRDNLIYVDRQISQVATRHTPVLFDLKKNLVKLQDFPVVSLDNPSHDYGAELSAYLEDKLGPYKNSIDNLQGLLIDYRYPQSDQYSLWLGLSPDRGVLQLHQARLLYDWIVDKTQRYEMLDDLAELSVSTAAFRAQLELESLIASNAFTLPIESIFQVRRELSILYRDAGYASVHHYLENQYAEPESAIQASHQAQQRYTRWLTVVIARLSYSSHIDIRVESEPDRARFTMSSLNTEHTISTNDSRRVSLGMYSYKVEKYGFKSVSYDDLDLFLLAKGVIKCVLVPSTEPDDALPCKWE